MKNLVSIIIVTYNRKNDVDACLRSVFKSTFKKYEVIVVDNASTDDTVSFLEKNYKNKIKLIKSKINLMAGGGRNLGAKSAKGEYILFIDSDNIIDKKMIEELLKSIETLQDAGMVGPLMYYYNDKDTIWWAGADINLWTSKTTYKGIEETDNGQYNSIEAVGHIPNVFMIKKSLFQKVGGIDKDYIMHYEESDLAEKIKKLNYKLYRIPRAKTYHNVPLNSENEIRNYGGENIQRIYFTSRNRILFMKKNSNKIQYIFFLFICMPLFTLLYLIKLKKYDLIKYYLIGLGDGIFNKSRNILL